MAAEVKEMSRDRVLRSLYYDVTHPAGFSSKKKLFTAAKEFLPNLEFEDVEEWLRGETVYTLHRPARQRFGRNMTIAHGPGEWCQADLADMQSYDTSNDGYRFLLTFIDVFSKKATAKAIKSKNMADVSKALDEILKEFQCRNLLTDRGLEFRNSAVQAVVEKYDIRLCFTYNEAVKASVVERFNRTLKTRMHKYLTSKGTRRYIDVLTHLLSAYNSTVHSSTGVSPDKVDAENTPAIFKKLYGCSSERQLLNLPPKDDAKFNVGDQVRIRYHLTGMQKSYLPMFSDQVFTVIAVVADHPFHMYRLRNWKKEALSRKYYAHDLQLVSKDVRFRVEKVIKRQRGMSLVKWLGYPHEANSWVRKVRMV